MSAPIVYISVGIDAKCLTELVVAPTAEKDVTKDRSKLEAVN